MIRVRLFAAVREMAGAAELEIEAGNVGEVLAHLSERLGPRFDRIMASGSVMVNGQRADPDLRLEPGAEVAVLPPVSGGGREYISIRGVSCERASREQEDE